MNFGKTYVLKSHHIKNRPCEPGDSTDPNGEGRRIFKKKVKEKNTRECKVPEVDH